MHSPVSCRQPRRLAKAFFMPSNASLQIKVVLASLLQHHIPADDTPIHFIQPHLAPEFYRTTSFMADNNLSVLLKQTDDFLLGWHPFSIQHPTLGLGDSLFYQGQKLVQLLYQPLGQLP
jgi:hypothetical protein